MALAAILFGFAAQFTSAFAQDTTRIPLNQTWRWAFPTANILDNTGWETPGYDDSGAPWASGQGTFSWETTQATIDWLAANAPVNTTMDGAPAGRMFYARTHFDLTGVSLVGLTMVLSNVVDDGCVIFINGIEQARIRVAAATPVLFGQFATGTPPTGGDSRAFEPIILDSSALVAGDNVIAVAVFQNGTGSSDMNFNLSLTTRAPVAPTITDANEPADAQVDQGTSHTLSVFATGVPDPTYQWFFQPEAGGGFTAIFDATNSTYTIDFMEQANAGSYFATVSNPVGSVNSRTAAITFNADFTPPSLVSAVLQPSGTNIVITFSEPMETNALDRFNYLVCTDDTLTDCPSVLGTDPTDPEGRLLLFVPGSGDTQVLLATDPLVPGQDYLAVATLVSDKSGNTVFDLLMTPVVVPLTASFQDGDANGYSGTQDTEVRFSNPDADLGQAGSINVDGADGGGAVHGLIRFDNIIGGSTGQIPPGSTIDSATLTFYTHDPDTTINIHRMLQDWNESTTWNMLVNGVTANDVQAAATPTANFDASVNNSFTTVDVTADVAAWAAGEVNYGWALLPTANNGWDFWPSEYTGDPTQRPALSVTFIEPSGCEALTLGAGPATNVFVVEQGFPIEFGFVVNGFPQDLLWFKDGVAVSSQTEARLRIAAADLSDAGSYTLQASNQCTAPITSPAITLIVTADTDGPVITSATASGSTALTTVRLTFDEALGAASAGNPASYSFSPAVTVTSATPDPADPTAVDLVIDNAPFGVRYTVTTTVQDLFGNPATPPGNSMEVTTALLLLDWDAVWKYDINNVDLITANYQDPAFDDSLWASGPGILGTENGNTTLTLGTTITANQWTSYYRNQLINWPYAPGGVDPAVEIVVRHAIDDGVVFHFNGVEAFRFNTPAAPTPITHAGFVGTVSTGDATIQTNTLPVTVMVQGVNTIAADLHAGSAGSSDNVFGAQVWAVLPPIAPLQIVDTNYTVAGVTIDPTTNQLSVIQGQSFSIQYVVTGTDPKYQWSKDAAGIPGAEADTYSVAISTATDGGVYSLEITNSLGSTVTSPSITVLIVPETDEPALVSAVRQADQVTVLATADEALHPAGATNIANYTVCAVGGSPCVNVIGAALSADGTEITLTTDAPVPEGYELTANVTDLAGNSVTNSPIAIVTPSIFQEGTGGYVGTEDTFLRQNDPTTPQDAATVLVDGEDPAGVDHNNHGLLRFNNIIGSGAGQILPGATINSAILRLRTENNSPGNISLHRMLVGWDEASTWDSMVGGVTADDVEALIIPDGTIAAPGPAGTVEEVDVTAAVQAWANGAANHGWALTNDNTDGYRFDSSEATDVSFRPMLIVDWTGGDPCSLALQLVQDTTISPASPVNEGTAVTISVSTFGGIPAYQWQKDGVDIPGATSSTYAIAVASEPADEGTYRCVITDTCPSGGSITTGGAFLDVVPDDVAPALLTAVAKADDAANLTTVVLTFDEALAPAGAGTPGNYTVQATGGSAITVTDAALDDPANPTVVTLTLASAIPFCTEHTVTVGAGVTDQAISPNSVSPNQLVILQQVVLLPYGATWDYDESQVATNDATGAIADGLWTNSPAFYDPTFTPAGWLTGTGILFLENNIDNFPAPTGTVFTVSTETIYLRGGFMNGLGVPGDAALVVNQTIDDGTIVFLNGAELYRYKMTNAPLADIRHNTLAESPAVGNAGELSVTNDVTSLLSGANSIAASLHPVSRGSSDAVFGLEVVLQCPAGGGEGCQPTMTISQSGCNVTISWSPDCGTLEEAPTVLGPWTPVAGATNPLTVDACAAGGMKYYRVLGN